jgi:hypothetical protein
VRTRRATTFVTAVVLVLVGATASEACTGFAAYDERPLYGMNFDYPSHFPMKLFVDASGDVRTFALAFIRDGRPARTVGMNSLGLFGSTQELHPLGGGKDAREPGELFLWEVVQPALAVYGSVDDAVRPLETRRLVQHESVRLHALLADASGRAVIVEPGDDGNDLTWMDGDFIVMTNFCNADLVGRPTEEARGVGADRYQIAHGMLSGRPDDFGVEDAMDVLKATSWDWTRASMVFDPRDGVVYLALEGDYSKIYRITLDDSMVRTHSGFDEDESWPIRLWGLPTAILSGESKPGFLERVRMFLGRGQ